MAQPIFVIGRIRSGTKWLSNIFAGHPDVAAISGRSVGLLSTCMFDRLPDTFGDLRIDSNFYAFAACYSKTDFFRLTHLPEEFLYRLDTRNYFEIFRAVMDAYANRNGRSMWVQKSKSIYLPQLYRHFPDAKFIIIRRNLLDNVRSTIALGMQNGSGRASALITALSYYHHQKAEEAYRDRDNVRLVRFEGLKADTENVIRELCDFVEIDFHPSMLDTGYSPNTSYVGKVERDKVLRSVDSLLLSLANPLIRTLPFPVLDTLQGFKSNIRKQPFRRSRLLPSYFNMLKQELAANERESTTGIEPVPHPIHGDRGPPKAAS